MKAEGVNQILPGEWEIPISKERVGALARFELLRASEAAEDRDDAVHRGLALLMAGFALLNSNGTHRGTLMAWVNGYLDKLYGRMN